MFGWHGQYLRVDLSEGRYTSVHLDATVLRRFVGGVGLGTWLIAHETPPGLDPLGPEAALAFVFSPLVGSPLTTSAKFAIVGFSPLTGRLCDALCSSTFALAGKRTGHDAIVLTGQVAEPSIVFVDASGEGPTRLSIEPAGSLVGLPAVEAEAAIRQARGSSWQVASIGPAGEQLIRFATISHDGRHAGRGGLGAVLGSKRIKALAVRGDRRAPLADPEAALAIARDLSARSFGPATEKYRELGTVANLLVFNRLQALPTRNFQAGHFAAAERLAPVDLAPSRTLAKNSCAACTIGCEHIYAIKPRPGRTDDPAAPAAGVRMEYESLFALGPLCGIDDPQAVLRAAALCDRLGLDTISVGGTLAFAMECVERGWIAGRLPGSDRTLRFGDGAALSEAIEALAGRRGELGRWLALGSRAAATELGPEALTIAPQVKGLELPGYHPARLPAMALGLAVGTRGADHNRSGAYEADLSERLSPDPSPAEVAGAVVETEDRAAMLDALILCKFVRGALDDLDREGAAMLQAVTGVSVTADELRTTARRIVTARKCLNLREGWTRAEDILPDRLFESAEAGTRPPLSRAVLQDQIDAYYHARGWVPESGAVPDALRDALGLDDPAFGPRRGPGQAGSRSPDPLVLDV